MPSASATWRASSVLPVPGSPLMSSGRSSATAQLTASTSAGGRDVALRADEVAEGVGVRSSFVFGHGGAFWQDEAPAASRVFRRVEEQSGTPERVAWSGTSLTRLRLAARAVPKRPHAENPGSESFEFQRGYGVRAPGVGGAGIAFPGYTETA